MKKIRCKVCHSRFTPQKEAMYLSTEKVGTLSALTTPSRIYECFDCPKCGCQIAANIRMTPVKPLDEEDSDG